MWPLGVYRHPLQRINALSAPISTIIFPDQFLAQTVIIVSFNYSMISYLTPAADALGMWFSPDKSRM